MYRGEVERIEYVRAYVTAALPLMRLAHWDLDIREWKPKDGDDDLEDEDETTRKAAAEDETYAEIAVEDKSNGATLYIRPEFWELSPDQQRRYLVHELCHIHTAAFAYDSQSLLRHVKNQTSRTAVREILERREEVLTDEIARMVAPHLPEFRFPD